MSTVEKHFDYNHIWANNYGDMQQAGPVHRHMKRIVRGLLAPLTYESVLDIGCGPGANVSLLCEGQAVTRFSGIDISTWAVEQARENFPEGNWRVGDVQTEQLAGQWDLVFSSLLLEHVADDVGTLRNMRAMTGKYLLITTIAGNFARYRKWDERMGHVRNYQVGELEAKMKQAGFTVEHAVYWGFPFYTPIARTLQNYSKTGTGRFGTAARLAATTLYYLYMMNSHRRGDLLVILAHV